MKAHEFYLQEALRNALRLKDRGNQLLKDTREADKMNRDFAKDVRKIHR